MAISTFCCPEAGDLILETHSEGAEGSARVVLHGELDIAGVPLLEGEWERIEQRGKQLVTLDLKGLTFIDAAGLGAILSAADRASEAGRTLSLANAGRAVRRIFDLTGYGALLR